MKGMKVIVSSALFLSTASFAPLTAAVRLDDAEVGFRLHLGLPRQKGMDVSDREMDSLAVTTNGTLVTAVWKGHPVLGKDFAATAVFTRTGEGWTYSFSWRGPSPSRLPVEEVSFPDVSVPRTAESGVLHSRAHGMGVIRRPDWGAISPSEPFVEGAMRNFQFIALLDENTTGWYVDARDGKARVKRAYAYGDDRADGDLRVRMGITYGVPATAENACAFTLPWQGVITPFHGGWWEAAAVYRPWARQQSWYRNALARKRSPKALRLREIGLWAWNRGPSTEVAPPIRLVHLAVRPELRAVRNRRRTRVRGGSRLERALPRRGRVLRDLLAPGRRAAVGRALADGKAMEGRGREGLARAFPGSVPR